MMSQDELARTAFQAYATRTGDVYPPFEQLPYNEKNGWIAVGTTFAQPFERKVLPALRRRLGLRALDLAKRNSTFRLAVVLRLLQMVVTTDDIPF